MPPPRRETQGSGEAWETPVRWIPGDEDGEPEDGVGLCLSGGGYRAMLFHLGALVRINELGMLGRLVRVSSVSGGSVTAGVLGLAWGKLEFDDRGVAAQLEQEVVRPLRALATGTLDWKAVALGLLSGGANARLAAAYKAHLFGNATLQDLPEAPRFVINATNLRTGVLWRFSRPYMADYRVGVVREPRVPLATAVAASSAFPPALSPCRLKLEDEGFVPGSGEDLQCPPFTVSAVLADGGVYDNLGLETVWKRYRTVLVSDGGGALAADGSSFRGPAGWLRHAFRNVEAVDGQVRALRKRQLIGSYTAAECDAAHRKGAYWGIRSDIENFDIPDALPGSLAATTALAETPTRLARLDSVHQERLINWGYAVSDAAIRTHVLDDAAAPSGLPYPDSGLGAAG